MAEEKQIYEPEYLVRQRKEKVKSFFRKMVIGEIIFLAASTYIITAVTFKDLDLIRGYKRMFKEVEEIVVTTKKNEDLVLRVLKKAEMHDSQPGLSFVDQAALTKNLGYDSVIIEGKKTKHVVGEVIVEKEHYVNFDYLLSDITKNPGFYLIYGENSMKISEEKILEYLKGSK